MLSMQTTGANCTADVVSQIKVCDLPAYINLFIARISKAAHASRDSFVTINIGESISGKTCLQYKILRISQNDSESHCLSILTKTTRVSTPTVTVYIISTVLCGPGGSWSPDLLIMSQLLWPTELQVQWLTARSNNFLKILNSQRNFFCS